MNTTNGLRKWRLDVAFAFVILLAGCGAFSDDRPLLTADLTPPTLLSVEATGPRTFLITFDEEVVPGSGAPAIEPPLDVDSVTTGGYCLEWTLARDQEIGVAYVGRGTAEDSRGNRLGFLFRFYGWNPNLPAVVINEFNPRGSSTTPDCVELFVTQGGNLGGLTLRIGTEGHGDSKMIFPAVKVDTGEYLVVHMKSVGTEAEVDEVGEDLSLSGGLVASDSARDFWFPGSPGLPGNNGAITLYQRPYGPLMDAVIYTDRGDDPTDSYRGWTATTVGMADELSTTGEWIFAGEMLMPSDAVDVGTSTATRSINRNSTAADDNRKEDWHVVPTRGQTLGSVNDDTVYVP